MATKNPYGKTVDKAHAYFTLTDPNMSGWTWYVLKVNQSPAKALQNPYASAFCLVISPHTGPSGDMGDTYINEIPGLREKLAKVAES